MKIRKRRKIKQKIPLIIIFILFVYYESKLHKQQDQLSDRTVWMNDLISELRTHFPETDWPEPPKN